tara:strand:- start:1094 stop:1513 length:420 start_codon:yes stop_codon:yes gene_type:complete
MNPLYRQIEQIIKLCIRDYSGVMPDVDMKVAELIDDVNVLELILELEYQIGVTLEESDNDILMFCEANSTTVGSLVGLIYSEAKDQNVKKITKKKKKAAGKAGSKTPRKKTPRKKGSPKAPPEEEENVEEMSRFNFLDL